MRPYSSISLLLIMCATALAAMPLGSSAQQRKRASIVGGRIALSDVRAGKTGQHFGVGMTLALDSLHLPQNRRIVLTPMLVGSSDSVALRPIVINDARQQIMYSRRDHKKYDASQAYVVRRHNGQPQQLQYSATTPYQEWMRQATVKVSEDMCGCGDVQNQTQETIRRMYAPQCAFMVPVAAATKTYQMHGRAFIDFPVNRTELHPDYRNNPRELAKIVDTINIIKADPLMTITNIDIHGYASPESPYAHNSYLAEHRAETLKNYVRQLVRMDDKLFSVHFTPEDWDGLRRYLRESNIDSRDDILDMASDETVDPDTREQRIKAKYPEQYKMMLSAWYPALRHSDYIVTCSVRPFSVDEARQLIKTKPQLLSQNEMFLVAKTYEPGSEEFNDVMETAVRMFPNDPTANLNAACSRLAAGQYDAAKPYLDRAGNSAEADNARGVYAWNTGNEQEALKWFASAADKGCDTAKHNLKELGE